MREERRVAIAAENHGADQIVGNIHIGDRVYVSDENVEFDKPEERDEAAVRRVNFIRRRGCDEIMRHSIS